MTDGFLIILSRDRWCLMDGNSVKSKRLLVLVYDGIENSVFENLVLLPAEKKIESGLFSHVDIVLFETNYAQAAERAQKLQAGLKERGYQKADIPVRGQKFDM